MHLYILLLLLLLLLLILVAILRRETGSGEPEESIIRTARGLYVGDLINEKE